MIPITCSHPGHSGPFEQLGTVEPNPKDFRPPVKLPDGRVVPAAAEGYHCADCGAKHHS